MELVNDHLAVKAGLMSPAEDGFLMLAGEAGVWRGPFSSVPGDLTARLKAQAAEVDAVEATVFRAVLRPPGEGGELLARRGVRSARYDVVVLIRTADVYAAMALRESAAYRDMVATLTASARRTQQIVASNAARIADVDHGPGRAFLFNYFYADDRETLLKVWEYTAGWFQARTRLRDSALMRPLDGQPADHGLINHASWPNLRTFLPSLLFRPTFRSFVLANFAANGVAAQPIIYRRV